MSSRNPGMRRLLIPERNKRSRAVYKGCGDYSNPLSHAVFSFISFSSNPLLFEMKVLFACLLILGLSKFGYSETETVYNKYKFAFNTGDTGAHSRSEVSNAPGHVTGKYQYKDPSGILRTIRYRSAPETGFQAFGDIIPQFLSKYELKPSLRKQDLGNSNENIMEFVKNEPQVSTTAYEESQSDAESTLKPQSVPVFTVQESLSVPVYTVQENESVPVYTVQENESAPVYTVQESESVPVYTVQENESVPVYNFQENDSVPVYSSDEIHLIPLSNIQEAQSDLIYNVESPTTGNGNISENGTSEEKNETESTDSLHLLLEDRSNGGVKEVTSLVRSLNEAGIKILHPPIYPFGFYRIPITLPLLSFPHTLPFVTNGFHYVL
ncbi:uncharacterized protein [Parasteatoda tepidariorum]|uniref:uncharacterized protein n=1 Tax=Parasteatoda tepidariorum TaxID=114398 RepID=UPI00077FCBA5